MTVLFDVNETLLDLAALDAPFERVFGEAAAREAWFSQLLRLALVSTITGPYRDFGTLSSAALDAFAEARGTELSGEDRSAILGGMRTLPPHPEVPESLKRLKEAGLRCVALTNSTADAAEAKLRHAGLYGAFEQVLSADAVGRLKPAPEPYHMAAERLGAEPQEIWFVAAHDWDIAGATRVGLRGAFVARPGKRLSPITTAEIIGTNLAAVADQILERSTAG